MLHALLLISHDLRVLLIPEGLGWKTCQEPGNNLEQEQSRTRPRGTRMAGNGEQQLGGLQKVGQVIRLMRGRHSNAHVHQCHILVGSGVHEGYRFACCQEVMTKQDRQDLFMTGTCHAGSW